MLLGLVLAAGCTSAAGTNGPASPSTIAVPTSPPATEPATTSTVRLLTPAELASPVARRASKLRTGLNAIFRCSGRIENCDYVSQIQAQEFVESVRALNDDIAKLYKAGRVPDSMAPLVSDTWAQSRDLLKVIDVPADALLCGPGRLERSTSTTSIAGECSWLYQRLVVASTGLDELLDAWGPFGIGS